MIGIFINLWNRLTGGGSAPAPALLDTYGGAAAAFSLRKLSSTYGGSAVRVRRSLDNTEQDIGFSGDNLDETALQAFVGYENLLTYSEEFNNAAWGSFGGAITANTTTAPNGTLTADTLIEDTTITVHQVGRVATISTVANASYTFSVYVKQASGNRFVGLGPVNSSGAGNNYFGVFDITNGLFLGNAIPSSGATGSPVTNGTISSVGNGWWRISVSLIASGTQYGGTVRLLNGFSNGTSTGMEYTGNGTSGIFVWGAQLNQGVTAQPYQVTTASANTANGFVTKWYTQDGNGENLLLQSQTINDAIWGKISSAVVQDAAVAPDGTTTAEKLNETSVVDQHYLSQTTTAARVCTYSVYLKAAERNLSELIFYRNTSPFQAISVIVDLTNGSTRKIDYNGGITASFGSQPVGNGWYRVWVTGDILFSGSCGVNIIIRTGTLESPVNSYLGVAGSGILIWGAQLSQSSWLQGYQATTTTAVSRRDASQATAASQPRIVNAGVIERENGKPAVYFNGVSGTELKTAYNVPTDASTFLATFRRHSGSGATIEGIFNGDGGSGGIGFYGFSPNSIQLDGSGAGTTNTASITNNLLAHYIMSGLYTGSTTSGTSLFANGYYTNTFTGTGVSRTAPNPLAIGGRTGSGQPTRVMKGTFQEGVLYNSNMLSSITAMNLNQNSYYQVYWQGTQQALLDQFGGSAAAFSLRNLSSSYRGPLVRVRRSSDNAETDIGGTFSGDLDVNSLLAFTGGQNLLLQSQDFTNASWTKLNATITGDSTIDPFGSLTADKITETAINGQHFAQQTLTLSSVAPVTYSVYLKAAEKSRVLVALSFASSPFDGGYASVDLSSGTIFTSSAAAGFIIGSSIQPVGNGWFRCSFSLNTNKTGTHAATVFLSDNAWQFSYLGVAGSGVYVWGAQLTTGSVLQPYIPTTTAAINGSNAFVTKWYDQSGIGDNLVLQSETFGNASWTKNQCTVSDNVSLDPFGGNNADKILENGLTAQNPYVIQAGVPLVAGTTYVISCYLKAAERNFGFVNIFFGATDYAQLIDLTTGSVVANLTNPSYVVENAGNGWWRLAIFLTASTTGTAQVVVGPKLTGAFGTYNTTANSGILIYGAQVSVSSQLLRYQPTTTAAAPKRDAVQTTAASQPRIVNAGSVESENGKPSVFYNGSNNLLINSIPLPSRITLLTTLKNTSNSNQFFIEHSITANTNEGFYFYGAGGYMWAINRTAIHAGSGTTSWSGVDYSIYDLTYDSTGSVNTNGVPVPNGTIYGTTVPNTIVTQPLYIGKRGENTIFSNMDMSELVLYNSVLGASLPSARSNINTYYQIYWQGNGTALLDSFSGASAAYSLRNLSSAYTGPLIRVRRSSDNAERDIYGTFRGDLDLAALTSFVGANSGFVTTWYDQSGSGRHATQTTAASQPRIVNAGAVETENGKPTIVFDGTNDFLTYTPVTIADIDYSVFAVSKRSASGVAGFLIGTSVESGSLFGQFTDNNTYIQTVGSTDRYYAFPDVVNDMRIATAIATQSSGTYYKNGVAISQTSVNVFISTATSFNSIGLYPSGSGFYSSADISEVVLFNTNQSASRSGVESNINNYYKIY